MSVRRQTYLFFLWVNNATQANPHQLAERLHQWFIASLLTLSDWTYKLFLDQVTVWTIRTFMEKKGSVTISLSNAATGLRRCLSVSVCFCTFLHGAPTVLPLCRKSPLQHVSRAYYCTHMHVCYGVGGVCTVVPVWCVLGAVIYYL